MNDAVRVRFERCQRDPAQKWDQCWQERQNARLEPTPEVVRGIAVAGLVPVAALWLASWSVLVAARRLRRKFAATR